MIKINKKNLGYSFHPPSGLYQSRLNIDGKFISLGYRKTAEEAEKLFLENYIPMVEEFLKVKKSRLKELSKK